jgi:hypothetical protein
MLIEQLLQRFEDGTLHYTLWDHQAHLRVALCYLSKEQDFFVALAQMRCGIIRYNAAVEKHRGAGPRKSCPNAYHETITRFWANQVKIFIDSHPGQSFEVLEQELLLSELNLNKRYIYKFYSKQELASARHRGEYVPYQTPGL